MALLARQKVDEDGLLASYGAANGGGDSFDNDGRVILHVKNADVSGKTVTITPENPTTSKPGYGELTKQNAGGTVAASTDQFFGPFPAGAFGALGQITYSDVTSLTIAVLRV